MFPHGQESLYEFVPVRYAAPVILRAKWVVPISRPPIEDGAVQIRRDRIVAVGRAGDLRGRGRDLGEVALLPGLVNAHCHLDYTDMAGQLWPSRSFSHWIDQIVTLKSSWNAAKYRRSWRRGEQMLLESGATTVGDIEAVAANLPLAASSPLRVRSFVELIDFGREEEAGRLLADAMKVAKRKRPRGGFGLGPHALYTASAGLIRSCAKTGLPMQIHLAESDEEWEMFRRKRGAMYEWFREAGRDMSDCTGQTPTEMLGRMGVLNRRLTVAHANCVTDEDIALLARRGVSVAHCPLTHRFFGRPLFPIEKFLARGVNVCLGTDSMASRRAAAPLDLFAEMRELRRSHPRLRAETILRMATANGARALGLARRCGTLEAGGWADVIAVAVRGQDLFGEILSAQPPLPLVMIGGKTQ